MNENTKNKCYKCNVPIFFTSKEALTPSGKPTKDVFSGKAIPLDPFTNEHHVCKPEDIGAFRETETYRSRVARWLSKQQQNENFGSTDTSYNTTSKNNDNNSTNQDFEKILNCITHTNAVLEQMQIDYKADMAAINEDITAIKNTCVVKTRKPYGIHVYWLSCQLHNCITTQDCKSGHEFEIKTNNSSGHATLHIALTKVLGIRIWAGLIK